jgi:hypothetical protein
MRRCAASLLLCLAFSCAPAKPHAVSPAAAPPASSALPFKRVDEWRFVDLALPPTPVELQLKRQFERVFANAQYSPEYACVAREDANFFEKHAALPEEWLDEQIMGRCGAPTGGDATSRIYPSDGTILDSPLSDVVLNDISTQFAADLTAFTVFGVTARAVGPNMLVMVETASPGATIHIGKPDADRNVVVKGEVFGDFQRAHAIINRGEAGSAACDADRDVTWPRYAFKCNMAPGDGEAWVSVSATADEDPWETPLVELPAHQAGWVPPAEYHRSRLALPREVDTRTALVTAINDRRRKIGRQPLHLAAEQSTFMQPVYEQAFKLNATGDWVGDTPLRQQMLKGDRVNGTVAFGRIASGIAFDGDAADWLAYRLLFPIARDTLMADGVDEIAIATHGDRAIGFGAAAVVYTLLSPERESALANELAESIAKARKGRPTQRLENPPRLVAAAREIARGGMPLDALSTTLMRASPALKGSRHLAGLFLPLGFGRQDLPSVAPLLAAKALAYGIVVTHVREPHYGWASPVAFVWFYTDQPPARQASQSRPMRGDPAVRAEISLSSSQ